MRVEEVTGLPMLSIIPNSGGNKSNGQDQRRYQRNDHRHGHRVKHLPLDTSERENRQIDQGDNADSK